jgi:hypothetical protein
VTKKRIKAGRRVSRSAKPLQPRDAPFEGIGSGPTLHYVIVPDHLPFVNKGRFWSGSELVKRAPRLAITQDRLRHQVNLLFCDNRWHIVNAASDTSEEAAKLSAERFYPGLASHWVDLKVSEAVAARYMERLRRYQGCSFCRRAPAEHGGSQVQVRQTRICSACITEFYNDLQQKDEQS